MLASDRPFGAIARRLVGIAAATFLLAVVLGCMNISFEGRRHIVNNDDQTYSQTGEMEVPPGQELEVFYPIPFASPPNLVIASSFSQCQMIEQRPDRFRVKNPTGLPHEVTWTARGMKGPPPGLVVLPPGQATASNDPVLPPPIKP